MIAIYFYLISFSIVGYGLFLSRALNVKIGNFGFYGILGIFCLIFISYLTSIFITHNENFNILVLSIGLFFLFRLYKDIPKIKKNFSILSIITLIFLIFILVGKNHDDFPYYHFPYISIISEYSHPIGLGLMNNGFRNPSSIFFLNSLFKLPFIDIYLFHIGAAFFLLFANLIFIQNVFNKEIFEKYKFFNLINLFFLAFFNTFFTRLAEHGTDRSGMIIIVICIIYLMFLINNKQNNTIEKNEDLILLSFILIALSVSLKPFYLIYSPLFLIFLFYKHTKVLVLNLLFSKTTFLCLIFLVLAFFYTFINSSCLIFPVSFTCFENLPWSISKKEIEAVKQWYFLWSTAGANPSFVIEDRAEYLSNFNWIPNWIENYFFNKVTDFILGITFLSLIFYFLFFKNHGKIEFVRNYKLIYFFVIFCFIEWFCFHPSLRYGGYHLITLLIAIPLVLFIEKKKITWKNYIFKSIILVTVVLIIFLGRNLSRLQSENQKYNYNIFLNTNYKFIGGNKEYYLRYNKRIQDKTFNFEYKKFIFKNILIIKK